MNSKEEWAALLAHRLNPSDLSRDADLAVGLMNIISLEEHLSFSIAKTGDPKYAQILETIRPIRRNLQKKLIGSPPAEEWCMSKHLLAASMRLFEVGTKELDNNRPEQAGEYMTLGYELYSLFFGLKTGVIGLDQIKAEKQTKTPNDSDDSKFKKPEEVPSTKPGGIETQKHSTAPKPVFTQKISAFITEIVNCCKE